jgi:hypothetical protein
MPQLIRFAAIGAATLALWAGVLALGMGLSACIGWVFGR